MNATSTETQTLLDRRKVERDKAIQGALEYARVVQRCVEENLMDDSDLFACIEAMASHAQRAAVYAGLACDLADVEKYGPGGGR